MGRRARAEAGSARARSEEHTSELQSRLHLVCRLLLEKKKEHNKLHHLTFPQLIDLSHCPSVTRSNDVLQAMNDTLLLFDRTWRKLIRVTVTVRSDAPT